MLKIDFTNFHICPHTSCRTASVMVTSEVCAHIMLPSSTTIVHPVCSSGFVTNNITFLSLQPSRNARGHSSPRSYSCLDLARHHMTIGKKDSEWLRTLWNSFQCPMIDSMSNTTHKLRNTINLALNSFIGKLIIWLKSNRSWDPKSGSL